MTAQVSVHQSLRVVLETKSHVNKRFPFALLQGARRSGHEGDRPLPSDPNERAAIERLCRQDARVYRAIEREWDVRKAACAKQMAKRASESGVIAQ